MVQTAEGALNEVHSMLQRIRELAVQYANGTRRHRVAAAIDGRGGRALSVAIADIATNTKFNGVDAPDRRQPTSTSRSAPTQARP